MSFRSLSEEAQGRLNGIAAYQFQCAWETNDDNSSMIITMLSLAGGVITVKAELLPLGH